MRVFVYEYGCATDMAASAMSKEMRAEGWSMLSAVLEDFGRVPGVEAVTLCSHPIAKAPRSWHYKLIKPADEESEFRNFVNLSDHTLIIAPEFEDVLLTRCRWVVEMGGRLIGPSIAAVELTGDKYALYRHLSQLQVPTPACQIYGPDFLFHQVFMPAVLKPRYGAGSQATFLVNTIDELRYFQKLAKAEGWSGDSIMQQFAPGIAASVAFIVTDNQEIALLPTAQDLSKDGRFHYCGGSLPLSADLSRRAIRLGRQALTAIAGLRGYVGVDMVLGMATDGGEDWVIEINPRITTSYVGLRALSKTNLTELMLQATRNEVIAEPDWHQGSIQFKADGKVTRISNC